jgi:hypothetical protein
MQMSGQHHAPAALYPRGKGPRYQLDRRLGGPQSRSGCRGETVKDKDLFIKCNTVMHGTELAINFTSSPVFVTNWMEMVSINDCSKYLYKGRSNLILPLGPGNFMGVKSLT